MVIIRLARFGRKKGPFYRIIAVDSSKKTTGANLGILGYWNPAKDEFKIERNKLEEWVKKGAQVSDKVKELTAKTK